MNMKRILALALAVLMVCLSAAAMAEPKTHNLADYTYRDGFNNMILKDENGDPILQNGDTITGNPAPFRVAQTGMLPAGITLCLNNLYVADGCVVFSIENKSDITLVLQGNNFLWGPTSIAGLEVHGRLIIPERGVLGANSITAVYGCDIILPDYYGPVPDGEQFAGWAVFCDGDWKDMQPGERVVSDGDVTILRVFDQIGMPGSGDPGNSSEESVIPATGDGANIALWCGLAAISAIGMAMLLRKKKEA